MKKIYALLWLLIVAIGLTACADIMPKAEKEPITITFYKRGYTENGDDITSTTNAAAVEMFQERNPHITVNVVGVPWTPDGDAILQAALNSGEGINVFSIDPNDLIRFAREGKVSAVEPFLSDEDKADFYASGFQSASVDGTIYAWPIWVTATSVYANVDILAERGIEPPTIENPWTWDEFIAAAKELTFQREDGSQVYGFTSSSEWWDFGFYPLFYVDGGRILSPDGRRFVQNSPEAVSGLQKTVDLHRVYQVTPPDYGTRGQAEASQQFKDGEVAMLISTPAFIRQLETEDFPLAILPPPTGDAGQIVTTGGFGMYSVYNVDDPVKLKASHEFAKYITGSQVPEDVPGYQLAPGLRRSNTSYATTPNREIITKLVEFGIYEASVPISAEMKAQYTAALRSIIIDGADPQAVMDEIAPLYQAEIDAAFE